MVKKNYSTQPVGVLKQSNVSYEIDASAVDKSTITGVSSSYSSEKFNDDDGLTLKEYKVSQWGQNNRFPNELRSVYANNIVPGLFDFKQDMYFGLGPSLFTLNSESKPVPFYDTQVNDWLESWDWLEYFVSMFADAAMYENIFAKIIPNKTNNKIHSIKHNDADECRISVKDKKTRKSEFIFVNNWEEDAVTKATPYPRFDHQKPSTKTISMVHLMKKSPGYRYYAMPVYVGILEAWLPLANEIPKFHLARMQKSLNIKYHIKIPVRSLEQVKELNKFSKEDLDKWLQEKLDEIDELLTGAANAGKTFYTFIEHDSNGKEMAGWQIIEVKNNEKEMSEANLQLYNETNQAITSAMQVQPSLACIQLGQKMSSGSEILNAYNLHVKTRTPIIRNLVCSPVIMPYA